jgi:hypothetical protein
MRRLGRLSQRSDEARQLVVGLVRQRNKVCYHLSNALATVRATLAALPKPRTARIRKQRTRSQANRR